jgi:hypothetical protein
MKLGDIKLFIKNTNYNRKMFLLRYINIITSQIDQSNLVYAPDQHMCYLFLTPGEAATAGQHTKGNQS